MYCIIEKSKRSNRKLYQDRESNLYATCGRCNEIKCLDFFPKKKTGFAEHDSYCQTCKAIIKKEYRKSNPEKDREYNRKWYKNNSEKVAKASRKWREDNPEKSLEGVRRWQKNNSEKVKEIKNRWVENNPEKVRISRHIRRGRSGLVDNTITIEQLQLIQTTYNNSCALTGAKENIHLDHIIPLKVGHVGNVYENFIPLAAELNLSKNAKNIIEWATENHERFGFTMERLCEVLSEVAARMNKTLDEYIEYINYCHANPQQFND